MELQADAYCLAGEYEKAIEVYEKLREKDWFVNAYASRQGNCYLQMGQYEEVKRWLARSLEIRPYIPTTNYRVALAYDSLSDRKKALEHLKRSVDLWSSADAGYDPAIEARAKLAEWES